jgi:hypothetical protein
VIITSDLSLKSPHLSSDWHKSFWLQRLTAACTSCIYTAPLAQGNYIVAMNMLKENAKQSTECPVMASHKFTYGVSSSLSDYS